MRRIAPLLVIAAVALGGCRFGFGGDDGGDAIKAQREAQGACLARAKDIFPQASSWEVQLEQGDQAGYGKPYPGTFTGAGGDFNWTFMTAETQRMLPAKVVCMGNTSSRQVASVTYDGTVRRPPEGVVWNY